MKPAALLAAAAFFIATGGIPAHAFPEPPLQAQGTLQPVFAPWDDIEALIVAAIDGARDQVLVQAYLLTSRKIATTLVAARQRGIEVLVLVDANQLDKHGAAIVAALVAAGIPVWLETKYQSAHNKIIIIDAGLPRATVLTGSFNFTWAAQHANAENMLVARDNPALAARYAMNWERHRQQATPYSK